jgi:hypothetical protein
MSAPTTISKHHVIAVACLVIVLVFLFPQLRRLSPGYWEDQDAHRETVVTNKSSVDSPGPADPIRTKPRFRSNHPKPTLEETTGLLRTTIIPVLEIPPDQPLQERIAHINELIQKAGVEPYQLRLILDKADPANQWRMGEMRVRNVPLAVALKYLCDVTKLRYYVRENGIVELTTSEDPDTKPPDAKPEFSNGDPKNLREGDPFAEPTADPFAEPSTAH